MHAAELTDLEPSQTKWFLRCVTTLFQRVKYPNMLAAFLSFVVRELLVLSEKHIGATIILDPKRRSFEDTILNEIIMNAEGMSDLNVL